MKRTGGDVPMGKMDIPLEEVCFYYTSNDYQTLQTLVQIL